MSKDRMGYNLLDWYLERATVPYKSSVLDELQQIGIKPSPETRDSTRSSSQNYSNLSSISTLVTMMYGALLAMLFVDALLKSWSSWSLTVRE